MVKVYDDLCSCDFLFHAAKIIIIGETTHNKLYMYITNECNIDNNNL